MIHRNPKNIYDSYMIWYVLTEQTSVLKIGVYIFCKRPDTSEWRVDIAVPQGFRVSCISGSRRLSMRPRQNGRHFPDDIFKCIFSLKYINLVKTSPKFVPTGQITNIPALVQILAWRRHTS